MIKLYFFKRFINFNILVQKNIMLQVRELLRVNDANGVRLLAIITDQFVADPKLVIWKAQETPMTDKCRHLWDQLGMPKQCYI